MLSLAGSIHVGLFVKFWKVLHFCLHALETPEYLCQYRGYSINSRSSVFPPRLPRLSDPIPGLLFLRRTGRNWNMATDRPAHPSPYPWTHWGLQLERDPPARISCLGDGKKRPSAGESSGNPAAVGKPTLRSKQTAQHPLVYFFSCFGDGEIVSMRRSHDSEREPISLDLPS